MINPQYLEQFDRVKETLKKQDVIQLHQFLDEKTLKEILSEIKNTAFKKTTNSMEESYFIGKPSQKLNALLKELDPFISRLLGKKRIMYEMALFTAGDYTLMHEKRAEFIIDITSVWDVRFGGAITFHDGQGNATLIPPAFNSAVCSTGKEFRFIKYLNHHARTQQRMLIIGRIS